MKDDEGKDKDSIMDIKSISATTFKDYKKAVSLLMEKMVD